MSNLFQSIKNSDFSINFENKLKEKSYKSLHKSFSEIIQTILDSKLQQEAHYHLLKRVINEVSTGIMLITSDGKIELINQTALILLQKHQLNSIHDLDSSSNQLNECIYKNDQSKRIIEINNKQVLVNKSPVRIVNENLSLISLQDIQEEVDKKEIEAWQKLIRTISHEILNSVTPISSLTETGILQLTNEEGEQISTDQISEKKLNKTLKALQTIEKRAIGLYDFVNEFRQLAKIPQPKKTNVNLQSLLDGVSLLLENELSRKNIKLGIELKQSLELYIDQGLIEQVLINLILNSIEAIKDSENPEISISVKEIESEVQIQVIDNGEGISSDSLDQIFTPFFSTKETGSGIGLSLSKQIMQMHGGTLQLISSLQGKTIFELKFKISE